MKWAARIVTFLLAIPVAIFCAYLAVELAEELMRWLAIKLS